jgi:hypothetical protein
MSVSNIASVSTAATLKHTFTASGTATIPSSNGAVYVIIGTSTTAPYFAGWVIASSTVTVGTPTIYSNAYSASGGNVYIYY